MLCLIEHLPHFREELLNKNPGEGLKKDLKQASRIHKQSAIQKLRQLSHRIYLILIFCITSREKLKVIMKVLWGTFRSIPLSLSAKSFLFILRILSMCWLL